MEQLKYLSDNHSYKLGKEGRKEGSQGKKEREREGERVKERKKERKKGGEPRWRHR